MRNDHVSVRFLCVTAMMTALVCVMTAVPRIPIPLGYAHLGDAMIVLAVMFAGKKEGVWAAGIGSALADILGGFPIWAVPTLIIKCVMALILGRAAEERMSSPKTALAVFLSMAWMVFGYTIGGAVLYGGIAVGLSSTPGLAIKAVVNIIVAYAVGAVIEQSHIRERVFQKN